MNIPNILTVVRIVFIPLMVVCFFLPYECAAALSAVVFALASATDWLDGYLARKLNQESALGAFLDPVADKLIVTVALLLLVLSTQSVAVFVMSCIIICREIIVSALREWMAQLGKRSLVAVSILGKVKTFLQMFAIGFMIWGDSVGVLNFERIGFYLLIASTVMAVFSMLDYIRAARKHLLD